MILFRTSTPDAAPPNLHFSITWYAPAIASRALACVGFDAPEMGASRVGLSRAPAPTFYHMPRTANIFRTSSGSRHWLQMLASRSDRRSQRRRASPILFPSSKMPFTVQKNPAGSACSKDKSAHSQSHMRSWYSTVYCRQPRVPGPGKSSRA